MYKLSAKTTTMNLLVQSMDYDDLLDPAKPSENTDSKSRMNKMTKDDDGLVLQSEAESTNDGCSNKEQ